MVGGIYRDRWHRGCATYCHEGRESHLECVPCLVRQALDAARMATDDESVQEAVLSEANRPIWFVLMAKCMVIAADNGCDPGSLVLQRGSAPGAFAVTPVSNTPD